MSQLRVNFLNWKPDADDFGDEGLSVADNVIHDTEGYKELLVQSAGAFATTSPFSGVTSVISIQTKPAGINADLIHAACVPSAGGTTAALNVGVQGSVAWTAVSFATLISATACRVKSFNIAHLGPDVVFTAEATGELQGGTTVSVNVSGYAVPTFS